MGTVDFAKVMAVQAMVARGVSVSEAAKLNRTRASTAQKWVDDPRYSTVVDEVAVMRALDGERAVFEGLTLFERARFRECLTQMRREWSAADWAAYCRVMREDLGVDPVGMAGSRGGGGEGERESA